MAFRWEVLADPTRDSQEKWITMKFEEPSSQESIERAFCSGSQNYIYKVTHPRSWGLLPREYQVHFPSMTQELINGGKDCVRSVRRISMTPPTPHAAPTMHAL
jgi:hypothetical protein